MDWANEVYVKLYTRDTTTWKRLGWEGQTVLMFLLRKVDRAGVLDIDELEPWEAVLIHCGLPAEVAKAGIARCLEVGTAIHNGTQLALPNFIEAQETNKSDALRAREYRARRREGAVTKRDEPSHGVTQESQNVMQPSRCHDDRHAASRSVTERHALLCSALLSSAEQSIARDQESPNGDLSTPPKGGADLGPGESELSEAQRAKAERVAQRKAELRRQAGEVYAQWVETMGKDPDRTKPTAKRIRAVIARLREGYTVADLKRAVVGCSRTRHNMGDNPEGKVWNDLELICRDGSHVERFRDAAGPNGKSPPASKLDRLSQQIELDIHRKHDAVVSGLTRDDAISKWGYDPRERLPQLRAEAAREDDRARGRS